MLVPALRDYMLCKRFRCSWAELQEMPEETVEVWEALADGERAARK